MAAPACFVTTFRRNMENELPADTEQCPPRALALGLDHCDFLAAMAPKPVVILAKERDFFDVRGAEQAYERLKRLYRWLGAEENIALFVGPSEHGYSIENREAMYSWFRHASGKQLLPKDLQASFQGVLSAGVPLQCVREPALTIESDKDLWCTPSGQVAAMKGTTTVFMATRDKSKQLAAERKQLSSEELETKIKKVLKLPPVPVAVPEYRIWQHHRATGYPTKLATGYAIETEPGIEAIVYRLTTERQRSRPIPKSKIAFLYLPDFSSDEELRMEPFLRDWCKDESVDAYTCDVRGCGESQPDTCGENSFRKPYGSEYFYAIHGLMLDKPLLGLKTWDTLRVLQWLQSVGYQSVHLAGTGRGTLIATFAGLLSEIVQQVTLKRSLDSYSEMAEEEYYESSLANILPSVLFHFDLPDCYRALTRKKLRRI